MPELPEVETVRRGLEHVMLGQRITRVEQRRPDLRFPFPPDFAAQLEGRTVLAIGRRAKYLVIEVSGGDALIVHLGMSGRLTVERQGGTSTPCLGDYVHKTGAATKHDHVVVTLGSNDLITYNDPRRFGFMLLIARDAIDHHPLFAKLGVEPLGPDLDVAYLRRRAKGKRVDLKSFLLDQRIIAGLGNIYVCEALHRAGLSPRRQAHTLAGGTAKAIERTTVLVATIQAVLEQAVSDYRQTDGTSGGFQAAFMVYGRAGQACVRAGCTGTISRIIQSQRSTFYCSKCQV
jgi:formamidopyrimidine-DNA glycosylase